jgi:hypothetical protein
MRVYKEKLYFWAELKLRFRVSIHSAETQKRERWSNDARIRAGDKAGQVNE